MTFSFLRTCFFLNKTRMWKHVHFCQFVWASNCQFILERVFKDLNSLRQLCGKYFSNKFYFQENSWKCASNVDAKDDKGVLLITINGFLVESKFMVCRNAFTIQIVIIKSIKPYNFFFISCHLRNFVVQLIFICSSWFIFMSRFSEVFSLLVVN